MEIMLDTLKLVRYDERYEELKRNFEYGESKSNYISSIAERLENSKSNAKNLYQSAFVVLDGQTPIG